MSRTAARKVGEPVVSLDRASQVLAEVFGFRHFRSHQADIIATVISGGDVLALMPTGGGKSLCYQIPALVRPGTGIVVSPLIALMQDQVEALTQAGVRAAFLNSTLDFREQTALEARMAAGGLDQAGIGLPDARVQVEVERERHTGRDQRELGLLADAEPQDEQRDQAEMWKRPQHLDGRIQQRLAPPGKAGRQPQSDTDRPTDKKSEENAAERNKECVSQLTVRDEFAGGLCDGQRRSQFLRREQTR